MKFKISITDEGKKKFLSYVDEILRSNRWTEGKFTKMFEDKWAEWNECGAVAFSSWAGAALAALNYFNVKGKTVLCPSNTFMATPLSVIHAGASVEFVDCNKFDLCLSFEDLKRKVEEFNPVAVWVVHIGGHIAFEINEIAKYCAKNDIILLEDCAHAHGASWNGKKPGTWGEAGVYSFYATKTITTGEGGMLVSKDEDLLEFARKFRNYGKFDYKVKGLNFRINEFTAALGCVQVDDMEEIVRWKNEYAKKYLDPVYKNTVKFPDGMKSGYYKYIVFEPIENSTGKVYDEPCHRILGKNYELPNTDWVANNHWCVPIYYNNEIEI